MRESLRVSIPTPCGEDWAKMLPAENGRHCDQCCKTVVDFMGMSDGEVLQFFRDRAAGGVGGAAGAGDSHGGVCGRFASDQLQRELAPAPVQRNGFKGWYLVLASAMMVAGREQGRAPLKPKMEQRRGVPGDGMSGAPVVLTDTVREEMIVGEVVAPGVHCVKSDTIKPDAIRQPLTGVVAVRTMGKVFHGVDTTAVAPPDTIRMHEPIVAGKDSVTLYGIAGGISSSYVKTTKIQTAIDTVITAIRDTIAAMLPDAFAQDEVVKVYPNPIARGGTIRLAWGGSGRYAVALLDLRGQIQEEREIVVAGKGQFDEWAVEQKLAPGVYCLRVSRPGKRAVTKEVVIQ